MASTYSTNLKIELIGTGEQAGTWGVTTNTNLGTALEQAIVGKADVTMSSTTVTLTLANSNAAQNARAIYLNLTGSPGGAAVLEVPAVEKPYIVKNGSDQQVTVKVSGQTGVAVPTGKTMWLYNNGTDVTNALDNLPSGATVGGVAIGTGDVVGPSSATDDAIVAFDGTTGKLIKAATLGTGVQTFLSTPSSSNLAAAVTDETGTGALVFANTPTLVSPVLGTPTSGQLSACTVDGTDGVGFRNTPVNSQSADYTAVLADSGKTILHAIADDNPRTFTIPANSSVAYPVGTVLTFVNLINTVTIAITTDTMYLGNDGATGSRTLAAYGVASAIKVASTTWIISGNGLT